MKVVKILLVLCVCLLAVTASTGAKDTVSIKCYPSVGLAPATVEIAVLVEPNASNRNLLLVADSSEYYTSSAITLDGDRSARVQRFTFKALPGGEYQVYAYVNKGGPNEHRAVSQYTVRQ